MQSYKDKTFCSDKECVNKECDRNNYHYKNWTQKDFPIAVSNFAKDEKGNVKCKKRTTKELKDGNKS